MATYAIGDVHGCHDALCRLLDKIAFSPLQDRLWLVGDLVNRGPASLQTLRLVRDLGESAVVVLGNHDLYLLKLGCDDSAGIRSKNDLQSILQAPDRDELFDWLRRRPLLHVEGEYALVHAGLLPMWTLAEARLLAAEVEHWLAGDSWMLLLANLWGDQPTSWQPQLTGWERLRVIINAMTRLRFCFSDGQMQLNAKGTPKQAPRGCLPWFDLPQRQSADVCIVFGHWSALGLKISANLLALDSGCVWGGKLTAVCLEDRRVIQVEATDLNG